MRISLVAIATFMTAWLAPLAHASDDAVLKEARTRVYACYGENVRNLDDGSSDISLVARAVANRCSQEFQYSLSFSAKNPRVDMDRLSRTVMEKDLETISAYVLEFRAQQKTRDSASNSSAQGNWVAISGDTDVVYSVETSSIKPQGNYVRAWSHAEFSERRSDGFIGYGTLALYDCVAEQSAMTQITGFSGPMLGQPNIAENVAPEFAMPPPGSTDAQLLEFVCAYQRGEKWAVQAKQFSLPTSPHSLR